MRETKEYLIGLDLGSSNVKGILLSSSGTVVHREKALTRYSQPCDNFIEFDADYFYKIIAEVIRKLVSKLPEGAVIAGIATASASGNTLMADDKGVPLMPVISWMDNRVTDEIERVFGDMDPYELHDLIGWPYLKSFPLAHLSWLKCHRPELLEKAARICMSTDYVNYRLTGEWGIDTSTATTFYLQDQVSAGWHKPFLQKLGISVSKLPLLKNPGEILGNVTAEAAAETGLPVGTPVVLGSFDHPCAARGSGVLEEGQLLISCGTSWVGFYPVKDRKTALKQGMLVDPFIQRENLWGVMFSIPQIANHVDRLICQYISDGPDRYQKFDDLSASSEPGAGGLLVNPLRDYEIPSSYKYKKKDIARAIMEGVAFLFAEKTGMLENSGVCAESVSMVGGPSETYPWPQIVCDILGKKMTITNGNCAGAAGAAILAGIGTGIYKDEKDALNKMAFEKKIMTPDQSACRIYKELFREFKSRYADSQ